MPNVGAGKAEIDLEGVLPFDGFDEQLDAIWARALVVEAGTRCCVVSVEATSLRGCSASTRPGESASSIPPPPSYSA